MDWIPVLATVLVGVVGGSCLGWAGRKRWREATTRHRRENLEVAVSDKLTKEILDAVGQYMGSVRREVAEVREELRALQTVNREALGVAAGDRKAAAASIRHLGDVKEEVAALRAAVQQATKATELMARAVTATAEATAGLTVVVAKFQTALGGL